MNGLAPGHLPTEVGRPLRGFSDGIFFFFESGNFAATLSPVDA